MFQCSYVCWWVGCIAITAHQAVKVVRIPSHAQHARQDSILTLILPCVCSVSKDVLTVPIQVVTCAIRVPQGSRNQAMIALNVQLTVKLVALSPTCAIVAMMIRSFRVWLMMTKPTTSVWMTVARLRIVPSVKVGPITSVRHVWRGILD